MLRVFFIGTECRILNALLQQPVTMLGTFIPEAPFHVNRYVAMLLYNLRLPKLRKWLKPAVHFGMLYKFLQNHNVPALKAVSPNTPEFRNLLKELHPDLGVMANFGEILQPQVLRIPTHGFINFHPSLLPRYRGPDPAGHVLLQGETRSGVTWYRVRQGIDDGEILAQSEYEICSGMTKKNVIDSAVNLACSMLKPLLFELESGTLIPRGQNETEATYYPGLTQMEKKCLRRMGKLNRV